jgi:hypothetical protein
VLGWQIQATDMEACGEVGIARCAGGFALGFGVAGLLVGTLVGTVVGLEPRWVPVSTNDVRVGLAPPPSGHSGLGLSIAF